MFGIVKPKIKHMPNKTVGIRKVRSQYLSMTSPIIIDPTVLPNLPNIIEMQTAMALKIAIKNHLKPESQKMIGKNLIFVGKSSTVEELTTLMSRPASSITR